MCTMSTHVIKLVEDSSLVNDKLKFLQIGNIDIHFHIEDITKSFLEYKRFCLSL